MAETDNKNILLKRVLASAKIPGNHDERIVAFFKSLIDLERIKEPDITEYFEYPLTFRSPEQKLIEVELAANPRFLDCLNKNLRDTWPKDVYVGLMVDILGHKYHLVGTILPFNELLYNKALSYSAFVEVNAFRLSQKYYETFELDADHISIIDDALGECRSFTELSNVIRANIHPDAIVEDTVYMALCSKNIALAQISSELGKIQANDFGAGSVLYDFLKFCSFNNRVYENSRMQPVPTFAYVPMDDYQRDAVETVLRQRLTVITGAPGTGKTQVILNLMANALVRGKSVLVASKNNKAVDNVKTRFDLLDPMGYLLRFGSKQIIASQTLPTIDAIKSQLPSIRLQPNDFDRLNAEYIRNLHSISLIDEALERERILPVKLASGYDSLKRLQQELDDLEFDFNTKQTALLDAYDKFVPFANLNALEKELFTSIKQLSYDVQMAYTGIFRFWNKLFKFRKHIAAFMESMAALDTLNHGLAEVVRPADYTDEVARYKSPKILIDDVVETSRHIAEVVQFTDQVNNLQVNFRNKRQELLSKISETKQIISQLEDELDDLRRKHNTLVDERDPLVKSLEKIQSKLFDAAIIHYLQNPAAEEAIRNYRDNFPDNAKHISKNAARAFVDIFKLAAVTSLSIKGAFPLASNLFDLLIIDEASQCDVASALPLILRAKQVVIIGDPMQLQHITSVTTEEENAIRDYYGLSSYSYLQYVNKSLWDYAAEVLAQCGERPLMLRGHYRCHHDIIGYSNDMFYGRRLGSRLKVNTDESRMALPDKGIKLIDVVGTQTADNINVNEAEISRSIDLACDLAEKYPDIEIGIITPFRQQADELHHRIPEKYRDRVVANTVHKFQGDEKDVIIYTLVVTDNSPATKLRWIDEITPNLVNVAVTRARQTLYVVCNAAYIRAHSSPSKPLGYLLQQAKPL